MSTINHVWWKILSFGLVHECIEHYFQYLPHKLQPRAPWTTLREIVGRPNVIFVWKILQYNETFLDYNKMSRGFEQFLCWSLNIESFRSINILLLFVFFQMWNVEKNSTTAKNHSKTSKTGGNLIDGKLLLGMSLEGWVSSINTTKLIMKVRGPKTNFVYISSIVQ